MKNIVLYLLERCFGIGRCGVGWRSLGQRPKLEFLFGSWYDERYEFDEPAKSSFISKERNFSVCLFYHLFHQSTSNYRHHRLVLNKQSFLFRNSFQSIVTYEHFLHVLHSNLLISTDLNTNIFISLSIFSTLSTTTNRETTSSTKIPLNAEINPMERRKKTRCDRRACCCMQAKDMLNRGWIKLSAENDPVVVVFFYEDE